MGTLEAGAETQLEHGTDLGLWLSEWIVEAAGGDLRFDSSPAGGTRVVVELPAAEDRAARQTIG